MDNQGRNEKESYKQPSYQPYRDENVGTLEWILTLIVLSIPCLNLFMMIIWSIASSKKSKRTYMRAKLIIMVAWICLAVMVVFCFSGELSQMLDDMNQSIQQIMQQINAI